MSIIYWESGNISD